MPTPAAFISYSREDSEFALRLAQDLKAAGAAVWLDQLDLKPGSSWDNSIEDALLAAPQMLVILSPISVKSENVRDEISYALRLGKTVIPVLYMECVIPLRLERKQHIDFRTDYARGLTALLDQLRVDHPNQAVLNEAAEAEAKRNAAWEARGSEAQRRRESLQTTDADLPATPFTNTSVTDRTKPLSDWIKRPLSLALLTLAVLLVGVGAYIGIRHFALRHNATATNNSASAPDAAALYQKGLADLKVGYNTGAADPLNQSCTLGDAKACSALAELYGGEALGKPDLGKYAQLIQKGCDGGDLDGCYSLAMSYLFGRGFPVDIQRATEIARKACDGGNARNCGWLSSDQAATSTQEKKLFEAKFIAMREKECDDGNEDSCEELITFIETTPQQKQNAGAKLVALLEKDCDAGSPHKCFTLARSYAQGMGVKKDATEAHRLNLKACDGGEDLACFIAGGDYQSGSGVEQSYAKADDFFQKACEAKIPSSCEKLAAAYMHGIGVAKSPAMAATYYADGCQIGAAKDCREACNLGDQTSCQRGCNTFKDSVACANIKPASFTLRRFIRPEDAMAEIIINPPPSDTPSITVPLS